jgi:hypothetical protein
LPANRLLPLRPGTDAAGASATEREIIMSHLLDTKETLLVLLCTIIAHAGALAFTLG